MVFFSYQAGFCKVRNVEDQVLRVVQKISDRLQRKDFSKANDSIWRQLLLHTFPNIGVPGKYVVWLWSFYSLFIYFYRTDRSEFDLRASSEKPGRWIRASRKGRSWHQFSSSFESTNLSNSSLQTLSLLCMLTTSPSLPPQLPHSRLKSLPNLLSTSW